MSEYSTEYYKKNRDTIIARSREYKQTHKEKVSASKRKYYLDNREDIIQRTSKYAKEHPEQTRRNTRNWHISKTFGITQEIFNFLLDKQEGLCAICRTDSPGGRDNQWHIDHDHSCCSGRGSCGNCVRALLCQSCNSGLGMFKDNIETLKAAILYLSYVPPVLEVL